jgi:hypothetical protein
MLWVIEDLGRSAALYDLAAMEHDGLIGELTHDGEVVTDQDVGVHVRCPSRRCRG